jgi:ABC-type cobalt transport system substrate-binding protein
MEKKESGIKKLLAGILCLIIVIAIFGGIGSVMGLPNMLNTIMKTAHDLLLNTVFYLMAICVITGALGRIFVEFGVVSLLERILRPLMKPLFNLPGVASLGAVMTFLSDNPAIISLAKDKRFSTYFKKYQLISLTNFGTAFGMGLLVIVFMVSNGFYVEPFIGLFGAFVGCIVSTRLMQRFVIKAYPQYKDEMAAELTEEDNKESEAIKETSFFTRVLNSLLDGGKTGVDVGLSIIPGVLIISTLVMILTFGSTDGQYTGAAYEGVEFLPWLFGHINIIFEWLFGFESPELMSFPITSLGAVGAALSLVPGFVEKGWADGNAIAVFTAIGMCWSGYLSTHTAMLDSLGYRKLTSKAILAHTVGGLVAGIVAHWVFVLFVLISGGEPTAHEGSAPKLTSNTITIEWVGENQVKVGDRVFTDEAGDTPEEDGSLARVIAATLLEDEKNVELVNGEKVDAIEYIENAEASAASRESLLHEVAAGFEMYRDTVAVRQFGKPVAELDEAERLELDNIIPYKLTVDETAETAETAEAAKSAEVVEAE